MILRDRPLELLASPPDVVARGCRGAGEEEAGRGTPARKNADGTSPAAGVAGPRPLARIRSQKQAPFDQIVGLLRVASSRVNLDALR